MRFTRSMILALFVLMLALALGASAQESRSESESDEKPGGISRGTLDEIRDKRRLFLIANRSYVLDSRGSDRAVIREIYGPRKHSPSIHRRAFNTIARRLNKYILEYRSATAVRAWTDADFLIVFKVSTERRLPYGMSFTFGEMFVIRNRSEAEPEPRIVWQTRHDCMLAEDAIGEFLKALKHARGER